MRREATINVWWICVPHWVPRGYRLISFQNHYKYSPEKCLAWESLSPWKIFVTLKPEQNDQRFQMHFHETKFWYFDRIFIQFSWWRHQLEKFSALLVICAGNSPVPGEFPTQRPVTRSFDVFFDLRLNKRLSKQLWGWWLETLSCPL